LLLSDAQHGVDQMMCSTVLEMLSCALLVQLGQFLLVLRLRPDEPDEELYAAKLSSARDNHQTPSVAIDDLRASS